MDNITNDFKPKPATKRKPINRYSQSASPLRSASPAEIGTRPMNYRSKKGGVAQALVIIILLAVLAALAGYFYFSSKEQPAVVPESADNQNYDNYQIPLGVDMPVATDQDTAANSDPTLGWLDYNYVAVGSPSSSLPLFTFKYPDVLVLTTSSGNLIRLSGIATSTEINIQAVTTKKGLADYLKEQDKLAKTAWEGQKSLDVLKQGSVNVAGVTSTARIEHLLAADLYREAIYVPVNSSTVVSINLIAPGIDDALNQFYNIFLSTFKFRK